MSPRDKAPPPSTTITILGLGSLLSERSARTTFPELNGFLLARVTGYRRVFAHSPALFVDRGIADFESGERASLSAEPSDGGGFVCSAFEVADVGIDAFREREEEFELRVVDFYEEDGTRGRGLLCVRSTDEAYVAAWGRERYDRLYTSRGHTIWSYAHDSQLLPCAAYLRHCALAAEKLGPRCHDSFLDETFLVDRATTIRKYLQAHPEVLTTLPPPSLQERYSG